MLLCIKSEKFTDLENANQYFQLMDRLNAKIDYYNYEEDEDGEKTEYSYVHYIDLDKTLRVFDEINLYDKEYITAVWLQDEDDHEMVIFDKN